MKRIIVIGCPGSGKSSLSIELGRITCLPLCHLDMLYWNADRTNVDGEVFLQRLERVLREDEWIIDGNYASSLEMRLEACDTVIFLDYPTAVCMDGIRSRQGKARPDMPWVERGDEEDAEFMELVAAYNDVNRPKVLELLSRYKMKNVIVLNSRTEAEKFLNSIR